MQQYGIQMQLAALGMLATDPEFRALLAERDRDGMRAYLVTPWRQLQRVATRLHVHLPGSVSFLRMHDPDRYGDDLSALRPMVNAVDDSAEPVRGIEVGVFLSGRSSMGGVHWIFGIALGVVLQRSRLCFTAALRDPELTGGTNLLKAVIIALAVATVGYVAIQFGRFGVGLTVEGAIPGHVKPAGLHTVIGAAIFPWWKPLVNAGATVYLPQALGGWIPALLVQAVLLLGLYILADWWGKRKANEGT